MPRTPIYRVSEVRAIEARAAGEPLMERAGLAAAEVARAMLAERSGRIVLLAGPGNNGGDAFVMARHLKSWFFDIAVVCNADPARLPPDAATALARWRQAGGDLQREWRDQERTGLIVDGLFGIGLARPIEGEAAAWIERANRSDAPVLALDVPSGLDADTGVARTPTVRASATATFIGLKPGLLTADGCDHCGRISVHDLGLSVIEEKSSGVLIDWEQYAQALPQVLRRTTRNVHKGSFGTLAIVGGGEGMVGATILAGRAALFAGAGKVFVGILAERRPAYDAERPELMLRDASAALQGDVDAVVIGPGLGTSADARELLERALRLPVPLVIDADALNLLAADRELERALAARERATLLTPHPGEAARMLQSSTAAVQGDRLASALELARRCKAAIVLKGAGSVLAFSDGEWAINGSGNPALASGGTGDVLAGMLGALLAQGLPARVALEIGVALHGAAADALVARGTGPVGVVASELAPVARELLNRAAASSGAAGDIASGHARRVDT